MKSMFQKKIFIKTIFALVGLAIGFQPVLISAQAVRSYSTNQEILFNSDGTIQENKNYIDPSVRTIESPLLDIKGFDVPLDPNISPIENLDPVAESVRNGTQPSSNIPAKSLAVLKSESSRVTALDESKALYQAEGGVTIIEQSLSKRFRQSGEAFEEINFSPLRTPRGLKHDSGTIRADYYTSREGVQLTIPNASFNIKAYRGNNVTPIIESDTVVYKQLWNNIDVAYEYHGDALKEYIVIKNKQVGSAIDFQLDGATVSHSESADGGIDLSVDGQSMYMEQPLVIVNGIGPVQREVVAYEVIDENTLRLNLDSSWINSLNPENFPITIASGPIWGQRPVGDSNRAYRSYKTGGYNCNYTLCDINIGGLIDGGQQAWRSEVGLDFLELNDPNKNFLGAYIQMEMSTKSGRWNGFYDTNALINVGMSGCSGFHCVVGTSSSAYMTTAGTIDVTNTMRWMMQNGHWGSWFMFYGQEDRGDTFKAFDARYMKLNYAFNYKPNNNATLVSPLNNAVVTNPNQILRINAATDPDSDPLEYNFVLSDSNGTILQQSGYSNALTMPIADGVLQDGVTYTWRVYVKDSYFAHSSPAITASFKVDYRTGKDATQAYDSAGPVMVNLSNGNAYTTNSSHAMNALGGSIGIQLEYNSPQLTKEGLSARYWNNSSFTGNPVYTRIDQAINYLWGTSSPFKGIVAADNFSVSWKGYFVAPSTGAYRFATNADDNVWFYGDGNLLYHQPCCGQKWTESINLTEGQVWPIQIDYSDLGGNANIDLQVILPNGTQKIVPSEYLRTDPVQSTQDRGLTGRYYFDSGNHDFNTNKQQFLVRNEPQINFDWGIGSPIVGGPTDNFLVRYEGFLAAPIAGDYKIGVNADDGFRVFLNGTKVLDDWLGQDPAIKWSGLINLPAGVHNKIAIEYYEGVGNANLSLLWDGPAGNAVIENKYLSPMPNILPVGWKLGIDGSGNIPFESLKVMPNGDIKMLTSDGSESLYVLSNGGYKPPVNEDGWVTKNSDGTYTFMDMSGATYIYESMDNSGSYNLRESSTPFDDKNPAGLKYEYASVNGNIKLRKIIDGVDPSRFGRLIYQGDLECVRRSGDAIVPVGFLCAFITTDNRSTWFHYNKGYLSRIQYPGNAKVDFGYLNGGRIDTLRDTAMIDAIEAGLRDFNESGSRYQFNYDVLGRINYIGFPSNEGNSDIAHTFEYFPRSSKQHIQGAPEPNGYTKYLEFDALYRTTKLCDNRAQCTLHEWDATRDVLLSSTNELNQQSTTIYDLDDRPIETYGPAPKDWFGTDRRPLAQYVNQVPKVETKYDEGMTGPSAAYYQVKGNSLFGSPQLHQFGINPTKSKINFDSTTQTFPIVKSTGMDGVGISLTGKITFPQSGTYTFKTVNTDGARIFIDDQLIVDNWATRSAANTTKTGTFTAVTNKIYRVKIDWLTVNTVKFLSASIAGPGIAETNIWDNLKPGYNLVTSNIVFDQQIGNVETRTNYADPAYNIIQNKILDPNGLNYTTSSTVEPLGTGFLRVTSKTSTGGSVSNFEYYGATEQRDNPCTVEVDSTSQAGFLKAKVEPDPDDNGPQRGIKTENVYNASGSIVATRTNEEPWNCIRYDDRGRVSSRIIAYHSERPGLVITNNFALGGNPLKKSVSDGSSTIVTEYDYIGNLVRYIDGYGNTTINNYDNLGRLVQRTSPLGLEEWGYDDYSQVVTRKLDQTLYAQVTYDSFGRVETIVYPEAGELAYMETERDVLERPIKHVWKQSDGTMISEELARSQSGVILSQTFTQGVDVFNQQYSYDKAGRLIAADYGDRLYQYSYADSLACAFTTANKNFNRTSDSVTIGGTTTTNNYCYDKADKLISSTQYGNPEYDSRGNTLKLGNLQFTYDLLNQNTGVSEGDISVNYTRDVFGRIIQKSYPNDGDVKKYGYIGSSTSQDFVRDERGNIIEKYISLPGLRMVIKPTESSNEYAITSSTGNVLANNTGAIKRYEPFGTQIGAEDTHGFGGSVLRETEHKFSIDFVQMGARVYVPTLGRFLQTDPVEGGTQNDYVYPNDPINSSDFEGTFFWFVVGIALAVMEVVDWAITAKDAHDCVQGSAGSCAEAGTSVALNLLPGPSLKWLNRGADAVKSVTAAKTVENVTNIVTKVEKTTDISSKMSLTNKFIDSKWVGVNSRIFGNNSIPNTVGFNSKVIGILNSPGRQFKIGWSRAPGNVYTFRIGILNKVGSNKSIHHIDFIKGPKIPRL